MSNTIPTPALESFQTPYRTAIGGEALSRHVWDNMTPLSKAAPRETPQSIQFSNGSEIYSADQAPALTPAQIKPVLDHAKGVSFTSPAQDATTGRQPDLILGQDGKLRANPNATPSKDGSLTIELQSKNKSETDGKKLADQLQKAAIKDLINYFRRNNPNAQLPQDWLEMLQKEPDLPPPVVPLDPAPAPEYRPPAPESPPVQYPSPSGNTGPGDSGSGPGGGAAPFAPGAPSGGNGESQSVMSPSNISTYDGAKPADENTALQNAKIVAEVAQDKGVDPATAIASMLVESGGNNQAVGDGGTSFGLFQLHQGGELGNLTENQAFDAKTNADVALSQFAANEGKYSDPGQLAAASQRPYDQVEYAAKVDATLPEARRLLAEINDPAASVNATTDSSNNNQAPTADVGSSPTPVAGADSSGFPSIANPTAEALQVAGLDGQCTYWASLHHATPWVDAANPGMVGNAGQWFGEATQAGVATTDASHPVAGAIACFGGGQDGHVAIVKSVNADGSFVVSEMNVVNTNYGRGSGVVDERTIKAGDPSLQGFIVGDKRA